MNRGKIFVYFHRLIKQNKFKITLKIMPYEFLEHTADLKIRVEEPTLDEAFKTSAIALKQAMAENIEVKSKITRLVTIEEKDINDLLYRFMEEFIYLLDADDFLMSEIVDLEVNKDNEK